MGITSHPASMHQLDASLLVLTVTLAEGGLLAFSPEKLLDPLSPHCPLQEDTSVLSLPEDRGGGLPAPGQRTCLHPSVQDTASPLPVIYGHYFLSGDFVLQCSACILRCPHVAPV